MKLFLVFMIFVLSVSLISAEYLLPSNLIDEDTSLFIGIGEWANQVTYGAFWMFMLLGFCVVLTLATMHFGSARAIGFGAVTGLLGSIYLLTIGWISWYYASFFIIIAAGMIAWMLKIK